MPKSKRVAVHGNYKGQVTHPRLHVLPSGIFAGKCVLDVGCNEGWVTCEIARDYAAYEVIGVDIDAELVGRAWRHRRDIWSLQAPPKTVKNESNEPAGNGETESLHSNQAYFPECFSSLFGPIPISTRNTSFPNNVSFYASDWASQGCPADEVGYDVVIAFSVSKWIHIHGGDDGLKLFFSRVRDVLRKRSSGGTFVLEAQPFSGYRSAIRKAGTRAKQITLSPDDFPALLAELGFSNPVRAGVVGEGGFKRPVDIYTLEP
ncbi:7SK snRNA methylphosphate capping enzyme [Ceratobasidium sp. AG-Ba]|nr:7SK snRNA methylphosphate capping enzyme [Ceratobasidium sp. AG-Ba]QRW10683.1 7SK snRNA methylphosphate capping enzyme [Ceratobasidium sp. AG-Ba]